MNLIQQLQTTSKWKEFEEWYDNQKFDIQLDATYKDFWFNELEFPFQKGVFEKFIESKGCAVTCFPTDSDELEYGLYWKGYVAGMNHSTFEELLIWYFNN